MLAGTWIGGVVMLKQLGGAEALAIGKDQFIDVKELIVAVLAIALVFDAEALAEVRAFYFSSGNHWQGQ